MAKLQEIKVKLKLVPCKTGLEKIQKIHLANELYESLGLNFFDDELNLKEAELDNLIARVYKYL